MIFFLGAFLAAMGAIQSEAADTRELAEMDRADRTSWVIVSVVVLLISVFLYLTWDLISQLSQ